MIRIFSFPTDSRGYRFLLSVVKGLSDFEFKTLIKWKRIVKIFQLLLIPGPWLRINWVSSDNFIRGSWRQEKKITNKDTNNQNNKQLNTPTDFSSKKYEKQKLISLFQIKSNLKVIKAANSFGADTDGRHATTTLRWLSAFPLKWVHTFLLNTRTSGASDVDVLLLQRGFKQRERSTLSPPIPFRGLLWITERFES